GGHAAGLLGGACKSPLPQDIDGLLLDAFRLGERSFALHHSRAGLLSQGLNRCRCYLVCHYCLFLPLGLAVTTSKKGKRKNTKSKTARGANKRPGASLCLLPFCFCLTLRLRPSRPSVLQRFQCLARRRPELREARCPAVLVRQTALGKLLPKSRSWRRPLQFGGQPLRARESVAHPAAHRSCVAGHGDRRALGLRAPGVRSFLEAFPFRRRPRRHQSPRRSRLRPP